MGIKKSIFNSNEFEKYIKNHQALMKAYTLSNLSINRGITPIINSAMISLKDVTIANIENIQQQSIQISEIINNRKIIETLRNSVTVNSKVITKSLAECNWKNIINNYSVIIDSINPVQVNQTIIEEYESRELQKDEIVEVVDTLKSIDNNTADIKAIILNKKPIIILCILFIISSICGGFFNKVGETAFDLIPKAFNHYMEENKNNSKEMFLEKFRIVNAEELNVREQGTSESRIIGKLYLNQCVEVIEKKNYWTKVKYVKKEKDIEIIGWVYTRYISVIDDEAATLIEDK